MLWRSAATVLQREKASEVLSETLPDFTNWCFCLTYLCSKLLDARHHLSHISAFEKIYCLENACSRYAICLAEIDEHLNVFHLLNNKNSELHIRFWQGTRIVGSLSLHQRRLFR
jgi:hypothetical protein